MRVRKRRGGQATAVPCVVSDDERGGCGDGGWESSVCMEETTTMNG